MNSKVRTQEEGYSPQNLIAPGRQGREMCSELMSQIAGAEEMITPGWGGIVGLLTTTSKAEL